MRGVMLRDGLFIISFAVYAGYGDGVDNRNEFDGVHFDTKTNFHGNFYLRLNGRIGLAGFCGRFGTRKTFWTGRRLLFCVADRVSCFKRVKGDDAEFQALLVGKYFYDNAANLHRRDNLNDFGNGHNLRASYDNGSFTVYPGRHYESGGGGFRSSEIK